MPNFNSNKYSKVTEQKLYLKSALLSKLGPNYDTFKESTKCYPGKLVYDVP